MKRVLVTLAAACSDPSTQREPDAITVDGAPDADGSCADGTTRPCGTDVGACELGTETCRAGAWSACEGGIAPATTDVCDGAADDDCDGTIDDGCSSDPFDPASCGGAPMTEAAALAELGALAREVLASATIQVRTRSCSGTTCMPWSTGSAWQTRFLTYSGGVVTRYQNVQADTQLVLYKAGATAKLSLQHVTFPQGGYTDEQGMVFAIPPAPITYPVFRAYNVSPQYASDYRDLELTLKNGTLVVGTRCARFTANMFGATDPYTTEYAALYRW